MDDALVQLLSLSNVILALAIFALVFVQRKTTEVLVLKLFKKDLTKSDVWEKLLVPLGPLGTGGFLAMIPGLPIPDMFAASLGAKFIFGVSLGLLCGLCYRVVKKMLLDKLGASEDEKTPYSE